MLRRSCTVASSTLNQQFRCFSIGTVNSMGEIRTRYRRTRRSHSSNDFVDEVADVILTSYQFRSESNLRTPTMEGSTIEKSKSQTLVSSVVDDSKSEHQVYRGPDNHHERVLKWGLGNKFTRVSKRGGPAWSERPKEISVPNDYYKSPMEGIVWEDLNEQWEVFWYEFGKMNARPFPVRKYGLFQAKKEAIAYAEMLKSEQRFVLKATAPQSGMDGVNWDEKTTCWVAHVVVNNVPATRSYSAEIHGIENALQLAKNARLGALSSDVYSAASWALGPKVKSRWSVALFMVEQDTSDVIPLCSFPKLRIAMTSDFFIPGLGGVEMHIYNVAQQLIKRGYKVIVITHLRGTKCGVRYLANGLKVYYIPTKPMVDQVSFPHLVGNLAVHRKIFLRERIDVVHAHQATSVLALECLMHAKTLGLRTIFTDHSLFGFADAACIHMNHVLRFMIADLDHACAVSNTNRENLVLRAALTPAQVSVIPNAVDCSKFTPELELREGDGTDLLTIVVLSRLTYRKGIDLLADVIPNICRRHPHVRWVIGGDGPKRLLLEEMRERHGLHSRVELLGAVPHHQVPSVLRRGHIFINSSLTEAFCIAIVEAASCGLLVVSTAVGGVPEVLPSDMVRLAEADPAALEAAVDVAIQDLDRVDPLDFHRRVRGMYSWEDVARRTEMVYHKAMEAPVCTVAERIERIMRHGPLTGLVWTFMSIMDVFLHWLLDKFISPPHLIEVCPDFPTTYARKEIVRDSAARSKRVEDALADHTLNLSSISEEWDACLGDNSGMLLLTPGADQIDYLEGFEDCVEGGAHEFQCDSTL